MGNVKKTTAEKRAPAKSAALAPDPVPEAIVRAAREDALLRSRVYLTDRRRRAILCDGEVVGFVTPHETPSGWRAGPIFVLPAYRGRGLVEAFYASHPDRTWVAFVPSGKPASRVMHTKAGFKKWKDSTHGVWMKREPLK